MALRTDDDPYPPSLPKMESPDMTMYGLPSDHSANHFFGQAYPDGATNGLDYFEAETLFSNATPLGDGGYGATGHPANLSLEPSHSSESSPTSSNSSAQHQRHASTNSSRSATFGSDPVVPDEARMHRLRLGDSKANPESPETVLETMNTESELDRQMNAMFDFDSAANSPEGSLPTRTSPDKPIAGMAMPHSEQQAQKLNRPIMQPQNQRRPAAARSGVSSPSTFEPASSWVYPTAGSHKFNFGGGSGFQNNVPYNPFYGTPTAPTSANNAGFVGPNSFGYPQPTFVPPSATFTGPGHFGQVMGPKLHIHPIPPKTRVETQIPITMTLVPMPPGITRLHLPPRTMAKPKLIAKPPPVPSPDMLELDVMPVCASAMKRPDVWPRAFAMARGEGIVPQVRHQVQRSSSDGSDTGRDPTGKVGPMEGGPISICDGCMMRERKRANRRLEKEASDEDIRWRQGEKERIVVFNETEVVDWKPYGSADLNEPASKRARGAKGKKRDETGEDMPATNPLPSPVIQYPELARQVRLLMRITCYCRHQGESEGFRVILTIKDHHGKCIAQEISSPILITDDHKTSAIQNDGRNPMVADGSHLHNGNFFSPAPSSNFGTVSQPYNLGQSHSTTDLPRYNPNLNVTAAHRAATSVSLHQQAQLQGTHSAGVSTASRDPSYRTSATLTPRNLSRQVSPSAASGPTPKRRKASGFSGMSHRPLIDLSMTRMPPADAAPNRSHSPSASPDSSSGASDGLFMAPAAVSTPPPTRDTFANGNTFEPHPDLSTSFDMPVSGSDPPAGVTASHHSNAQSPQPIQSQSNTDMTAHAQALHHSLLHVSGTVTPAVVAPTLARVIPSEGPKSGGIEVTILGEGFHSGLDVLFADAVATQTTVFNSGTMICLIPPSFQAGLVRVSLRGRHQPDPQVWFRYNDTDEEDLMRLALAVFHHRNTGKVANASDIARSIIGGQPSQNSQPFINGNQHPQNSAIRRMELELSILGVIDLIDQTDSVIAPRYSICRPNGQTMLHLSASLGYHRLVAGLLARGVNPDLRDRNGMSAMHMACLQGHAKVVRKLLSAGGDPTLRSLLGLAPIDMATTREVHQLTSTNAHHTRPSSVAATPVSHHSRASSVASIHSMWGTQIGRHTPIGDSNMPYSDALVEAYRSRPVTPADVWARSRRNSTSDKKPFVSGQIPDDPTANTHLVAAAAAMAAWRENLAGQIQHFQQSVQRTLPNLQMPNLPPLPNFEGYQELPMVRRISSLVPRMNPPAAPPAYEEIYPESTGHDSVVKKASVARAIGDALVDEQCAANFDRPEASFQPSIGTMTEASTKDQPEELRLARGRKVKKLSNDRKLFFVWIPLFILVVIAMTKDWAPHILHGAQQVFTAMHDYLAA